MYLRTYTASLKPGVLPRMQALCPGFVLALGRQAGFRHFYLLVDAYAQRTVQVTCWDREADLLAAEATAAEIEGVPWRLHLYAAGKATGHFAMIPSAAAPPPVYGLRESLQRLLHTNLQLAGTLTLTGEQAIITREAGQGEALPPGRYRIVFQASGPAQAGNHDPDLC